MTDCDTITGDHQQLTKKQAQVDNRKANSLNCHTLRWGKLLCDSLLKLLGKIIFLTSIIFTQKTLKREVNVYFKNKVTIYYFLINILHLTKRHILSKNC